MNNFNQSSNETPRKKSTLCDFMFASLDFRTSLSCSMEYSLSNHQHSLEMSGRTKIKLQPRSDSAFINLLLVFFSPLPFLPRKHAAKRMVLKVVRSHTKRGTMEMVQTLAVENRFLVSRKVSTNLSASNNHSRSASAIFTDPSVPSIEWEVRLQSSLTRL
jgi:hypothetical protein